MKWWCHLDDITGLVFIAVGVIAILLFSNLTATDLEMTNPFPGVPIQSGEPKESADQRVRIENSVVKESIAIELDALMVFVEPYDIVFRGRNKNNNDIVDYRLPVIKVNSFQLIDRVKVYDHRIFVRVIPDKFSVALGMMLAAFAVSCGLYLLFWDSISERFQGGS